MSIIMRKQIKGVRSKSETAVDIGNVLVRTMILMYIENEMLNSGEIK